MHLNVRIESSQKVIEYNSYEMLNFKSLKKLLLMTGKYEDK